MRLVTASLVGLLAATSLLARELPAQEPDQEPATQEREHVVRPGETLSDLAAQYFSDPSQWRLIYEANRDVLQDPDVLQPETVLTIPGVAAADRADRPARPATPADDARILGVPVDDEGAAAGDPAQPAARLAAAERPARAAAQDPDAARRAQEMENRTVFYVEPPRRPAADGDATLLTEPESMAVPVRPGEFLSASYLADPATLTARATFLRAVRDDRPGRGAATSAHPQDRVYLSYAPGSRPAVDDLLILVAVGDRVDDVVRTHRAIHPRGIVRVLDLGGEVIEAQIEEQYGPIYPGQAAIPIPAVPEFDVEAAEPVPGGEYDLEGVILEFVDDKPLYGPSAHAFIDLGRGDGVREGDIFQAYLPTRERDTRADGTRTFPTEVVAELRVVRVMDETATVRVDRVQLARLEEGLPVVRTQRIP